mgnify:CR=1 FL=1
MNAGNANLLNAVCLIGMSIWGYNATGSYTALIPMVFGAILLYFTNSIHNHNKVIAHIAVVLTFIILGALVGMRLPKSLASGGPGLYRVIAMIATSTLALIMFIKSFIDAKKARIKADE